jgi:hypothetical protein
MRVVKSFSIPAGSSKPIMQLLQSAATPSVNLLNYNPRNNTGQPPAAPGTARSITEQPSVVGYQ